MFPLSLLKEICRSLLCKIFQIETDHIIVMFEFLEAQLVDSLDGVIGITNLENTAVLGLLELLNAVYCQKRSSQIISFSMLTNTVFFLLINSIIKKSV